MSQIDVYALWNVIYRQQNETNTIFVVYGPGLVLRLAGIPRRYSDYPDAYTAWNVISSIGSIISFIGVVIFIFIIWESIAKCSAKRRHFTAKSGTKAAVLPKGKSSTANSGIKVAVLLGMNRCGGFPFLSVCHLNRPFKIWKDRRGPSVKARRLDLANCALRTSPKFTSGVKYPFHQGSRLDQWSINPDHSL